MNLDEGIKHAEEIADYDCYNEKQLKCASDYRQLAEWLKELKELREQTRWVPVSEKMPPIAQRVYVSATNGEVFIARYHSFDKWTFEPTGISYVYNKDSIVAWKLLPEPYKEVEE